VENLEAKETPASLDVVGGALTFTAGAGETNAVTVSVTGGVYSVNDTGTTITLGSGAVAAGWTGSGTNAVRGRDASVTSLALNLGDGDDKLNLRSANDAVTVAGDAGNDTITLSSNGALTGHLRGINATVTVDANGGSDTLVVSDYAATSGNSNVVISAGAVTGMSGPLHNRAINYAATGGGSFGLLRVIGSNNAAVRETFTLNNPGAPVTLDANAGNDAVNVRALSLAATVNAGAGNDAVTVSSSATATAGNLNGINASLTIDAGAGANSLALNDYAGTANAAVQLTATQVLGFAGSDNTAVINYAATGGTFGSFRLDGSNTAADQFTLGALAGATAAKVYGNGGDDTFAVAASTRATLTGGAGADAFVMAADGTTLTGTADGGAGADTLSYAGRTAGTVTQLTRVVAGTGYAGTGAGLSGGFTGIDSLVGGAGADALTGLNAAATWGLGASATYTAGGVSLGFSGFEALAGGSLADTFNVSAATTAALAGNGGNDAFVFTADGAALTGNADGGAGVNSLSYSGYTQAVAVTLTDSGAAGFAGTATGLSGGFTGVKSVAGGANAADALTGENVDSVWLLAAAKTYTDGGARLAFAGFESLQGGAANDTFRVAANTAAGLNGGDGDDQFLFATNAVTLTGSVVGGDGSDTLTYAGRSAAVGVTLSGSDAAGHAGSGAGVTGTFAGIDSLTGGGGSDTLTGVDVDSAWALGAEKTYNGGGLDLGFAGFEALQGGSGADAFTVTANVTNSLNGGAGADAFLFGVDGATLTGAVTGGGGNDTLSYAGRSTATAVALGAGGATGFGGTGPAVSGGFSGIDEVVGSGLGGLTGENAARTWTVDAVSTYSDGSNSLAFGGFVTLQGGSGADTFDVQSLTADLTLAGGAGADAFNLSPVDQNLDAVAGTLTVAGGTGADALTMHDQNTAGITAWGVSADAVTRGSLQVSYTGLDTVAVNGGSGGNAFDVDGAAAGVAYTLDAGSGDNAVTVGQYGNTWAVAGTLAVTGSGNNAVTVDATGDAGTVTWALTAAGITRNGSAAISFAAAPTAVVVRGGAGNDAFDVTASATTQFTVEGGYNGTQTDTLVVHLGAAAGSDDGSAISADGLVNVLYSGLSISPTMAV